MCIEFMCSLISMIAIKPINLLSSWYGAQTSNNYILLAKYQIIVGIHVILLQ